MPGAWADARARHPFPERAAETRPRVMMPAGPGMGTLTPRGKAVVSGLGQPSVRRRAA